MPSSGYGGYGGATSASDGVPKRNVRHERAAKPSAGGIYAPHSRDERVRRGRGRGADPLLIRADTPTKKLIRDGQA